MADYTIDIALYHQALKEMQQDFLNKNPSLRSAASATAAMRESHTEQHFVTIWSGAVRAHETHRAHRTSEKDTTLGPLDPVKLAALLPEDRERMQRFHEESEKKFKESVEKRHKMLEDHHRKSLIGLMTLSGINQATAEKIVDNHILAH